MTEFNTMLTSHVYETNQQYHKVIHDIFSKQQPDFVLLRKELIEKIKQATCPNDFIWIRIKINLNDLFNQNSKIGFYFNNASNKSNQKIEENTYHIVFNSGISYHSEIFRAFMAYFYTADPDVCILRDKIRAEFSNANISPSITLVPDRYEFTIEISYKLDYIKNLVKLEGPNQTAIWLSDGMPKW